jgi:hypothetical protein
MPDKITSGIEFKHGRCFGAAGASRRILVSSGFVRRERIGAMDDPDVILSINRYANGHSHQPAIRQRFGPERVYLEARRHDSLFALHTGSLLECAFGDGKGGERNNKKRADIKITLSHEISLSAFVVPAAAGTTNTWHRYRF